MNTKLTATINQAIICFTFSGTAFAIDCQLEGIKPATQLFNALEANQFLPFYDLDHASYEFISIERMRELFKLSSATRF